MSMTGSVAGSGRPHGRRVDRLARGTLTHAVALALLAALPCDMQAQGGTTGSLGSVAGGELREGTFHSRSLGSTKRYLVYLPPSYEREGGRRYPVAYYLHGAWGTEDDWTRMGGLHAVMDSLIAAGMPEMIVVMPDGDDSWYTTWNILPNAALCRELVPDGQTIESYCVGWPRYDDYIARDLVHYVDSTYRTIAAREHRGIGGLSMGGYGAVALALQYPGVFAASASHSGALAPLWPRPSGEGMVYDSIPSMDQVQEAYGATIWSILRPAFGRDSAGWLARDPSRRAWELWYGDRDRFPALYVDVGGDDFLLSQSRRFRDTIRGLGASLVYHEWDGAHSWDYWRAHVPESLHWMAGVIAGR